MRTETIKIFKFIELDDEAKEKARDWYREGQEIHWRDEYVESLKAFCKAFDVDLIAFSLDGLSSASDVRFNYEGTQKLDLLEFVKLWPELQASCPFTGVSGDEDLLAPFRKLEPNKFEDLKELLYSAFAEFESSVDKDAQSQVTDEYINDTIEANDYEFTENGRIF